MATRIAAFNRWRGQPKNQVDKPAAAFILGSRNRPRPGRRPVAALV
jgi:hypothetical protein